MSELARLRAAAGRPDAEATLRALALAGVAEFARARLDRAPAGRLVVEAADAALAASGIDSREWAPRRTALERLLAVAAAEATPLGRLLAACATDAADAFLIALAGEVESDPLLGHAIAELQAPVGEARPALHLVAALREHLFVAGTVDAIAHHRLVADGVLSIEGDAPSPMRTLALDARLWRVLRLRLAVWPGARLIEEPAADALPEAASEDAGAVARLLEEGAATGIALRGATLSGRASFAALLARLQGRRAIEIGAEAARDRGFGAAATYAPWLPVIRLDASSGDALASPRPPGYRGPLALLLGRGGAVLGERLIELAAPRLGVRERARAWTRALGDAALAATLAPTVNLGLPAIEAVAGDALLSARRRDRPVAAEDVAAARRRFGAGRVLPLAHLVERRVGRDALVLPAATLAELDSLIDRCRARDLLWQGLGPTLAATASPGVRLLFAGESGTGKTLAASYVATALGAPLYRCDLAAVMNKYVGESEKNIGLLLDAAEAADVILLFDEADALFGRRSEGQETGERYANMLTNFLLTRIEHHAGIAILTANSRTRIDQAFQRRFDAVLDFPAPGTAERLALWRSHLGARAPDEAALARLARFVELPGGAIRNAVVSAAAHAPGRDPLAWADLVHGLAREYRKLGRSLPAPILEEARRAGGEEGAV